MPDRFSTLAPGLDAPASHAFPIVPADGTDLAETTRALYVGTGGAASLVMLSGASVALANVSQGTPLPLRAVRVNAAGTTAGNLVGLV